ncbi:hypothetical protein GCM10017687_01780 [Streptomyces echinatus]
MSRRRLAAAAVLAVTLTGAFAPVAVARPADPVQKQLDLLVDRDGVPGALAYDGRVTRTAGVADLETGRPMVGERGRLRLASDTKAFTAVAVMRLVADGRIRLDDRAGTYLPQLAERGITVRQLLKQTSGLPEYSSLVDWNGRPGTSEDYLALALAEKPVFEPGTDWGYSNTNYLALGMLIDKVSGTDFRTYIERTVLRPLHLDDTYWPAPGELSLRGPHAHNYGVHPAHPQAGRGGCDRTPRVRVRRVRRAGLHARGPQRLLGRPVRRPPPAGLGTAPDDPGHHRRRRPRRLPGGQPLRIRRRLDPAQLRGRLLGSRRGPAGRLGGRRPGLGRPRHRDRVHHHLGGRGREPASPPEGGGRGPVRQGPLSGRGDLPVTPYWGKSAPVQWG